MHGPSAVLTHHSGRAASVNCAAVPANAGPASEPHSATPILTPTCLLVEVTAGRHRRGPAAFH